MNKTRRIIEVCANSAKSCLEAQKGGAKYVELCSSVPEGGTTPSYGEIETARKYTTLSIHVIVRPRGGDFVYSPIEEEIILKDIEQCKKLGVNGVVIGCLTTDGSIDFHMLKRFVSAAKPELIVTFHRAFDVCANPELALESIIEAGCDRLLTSGQESDAMKGAPLIAKLVNKANGRIIIMPGGGVNEFNIQAIEAETGAVMFHIAVPKICQSPMLYKNEKIKMGTVSTLSEFESEITDYERVNAAIS